MSKSCLAETVYQIIQRHWEAHLVSVFDLRQYCHINIILSICAMAAWHENSFIRAVRLPAHFLSSDSWNTAGSRRDQFFCLWSGDGEEIYCHHHRLQGKQEEQSGTNCLQNRSVEVYRVYSLFPIHVWWTWLFCFFHGNSSDILSYHQ